MIVLYTTHCPKCEILESKLIGKGISFSASEAVEEVVREGFTSAPVLFVDGKFMEFGEAVRWVNSQGDN